MGNLLKVSSLPSDQRAHMCLQLTSEASAKCVLLHYAVRMAPFCPVVMVVAIDSFYILSILRYSKIWHTQTSDGNA